MRTDRLVLVAILALLVVGCASTEGDTASLAAWAPAAETADANPPKARKPDRRKVRITVEDAVAEALAYNRGVLQSRLDVAIGGTLEREARSALLPAVRGTGSYRRVDEPPSANAPELGTSFTVGPRDVASFTVAMDFPIYGFGRHLNSYRSAVLSRRRDEAVRDTVESDIAAAVTAGAFDLLEGMRSIDVALSNENALAQQVSDSQALLDAGRVTKAALLEAQVEHDAARREREKLESAIAILRMTLNGLLGRDPHAPTEVVDKPVTRAPIWKPDSLEDEAIVRRPELRAARLAVGAAERGLKAQIGRELPELRGNLSYETTDNDFSNPKDTGAFILSLDIPIYTGGARPARIQRARYELDVARLALRDLETQIRTEVATRHREVDESFRDIEVAQRSIERSEESLRIQREKFQNGRATSREVLDSTSLLTRARFAYVQSLYNYNVALRELHRARGADPRQDPFFELADKGD